MRPSHCPSKNKTTAARLIEAESTQTNPAHGPVFLMDKSVDCRTYPRVIAQTKQIFLNPMTYAIYPKLIHV